MTNFKVHLHRPALLDPKQPKKWYAHVDIWGDQPRAYVNVFVNVPSRTAFADGITRGSCGCAQAWMEGEVDPADVHEEGDVLYLGPAT